MLGVNWVDAYLHDLKGGGWEKIRLLVAPLLILPAIPYINHREPLPFALAGVCHTREPPTQADKDTTRCTSPNPSLADNDRGGVSA